MNLILLPKFSPANNVRVWIGAFNRTKAPYLKWEIRPASSLTPTPSQYPVTVKEIRSVRSNELLNGNSPRTFSGLYEFEGCLPDQVYYVKVTDDSKNSFELRIKTLPTEIPVNKNFNILLVSCYSSEMDKQGFIDNLSIRISEEHKPDIIFLMGDQVYLDIPTLENFDNDPKWLAKKFEGDYNRNWKGINSQYLRGYAKILSMAPGISIPDDHEFWNNYPNVSPFIENSYTSVGRSNWKKAALEVYNGFQKHDTSKTGSSVIINIDPLSFFIADTRTNRDYNLKYIFEHEEFPKLNSWLDKITRDKKFGFIVSGQSFFQKKATELGGFFVDYEFPNYNDYGSITTLFRKAADNGSHITFLTGDVHWGRVAFLKKIYKETPDFTEIISSPSSMVTSPADIIHNLFGKKPWSRHSKGVKIEELNNIEFNGFKKSTEHIQVGDHVAIVSFKKSGFGIESSVTYFPTHWDTEVYNNYKRKITLPKLINL